MPALPQVQFAVTVAALSVVALTAQGAIVTYPNLASFLSAAGPANLESFEQISPLAYGLHPATAIGPFTLTSDGPFGVVSSGPSEGQHATDGARYLAYNARTLRLSFAEPITALSLSFVDFGDLPLSQGQELTMTTSAGDSVLIKRTVADFDPPSGNELFFGFTSNVPLTEITFHTTAADNMNIDAVRYAPVPEPSAAGLLSCGALWLLRHRRSSLGERVRA